MIWRYGLVDKNKLTGRIGMLVHSYYPQDVRVRREAETLSKLGVEVHVVCLKDPVKNNGNFAKKFEIFHGVYIHRLPLTKRRGNKFRYLFEYMATTILGMWKLTSLHLKRKFDIVHIHNMPDILVLAGMIANWTGAKLVLDIHDPMSELLQTNYNIDESHIIMKIIKMQEWICYRLADHLITVSLPMRENVASKSGRSQEMIKVVHNYPDLSMFPIRNDNEQWPHNRGSFVLLYSGTITEHYRLDIAVKATAAAAKHIPGIRLVMLGYGNRLEQALSLAAELGIEHLVKHIKPVQQERVREIIASADLGLSTHQAGLFGDLYFSNKILEFMSQGLPVLSSDTYTIRQYIHQDSIFYFEPENIDDLIEKIIYIYNERDFVKKKINSAKKLVNKYIWQKEEKKLVSFYENLLS